MSNVYVVYWSGTGNTQEMAMAIADGAKENGAEVTVWNVDEADIEELKKAKALALGCPSMGAEQLEEASMEPFMCDLDSQINGKTIALFGSYGWGDGQWMKDWEDRIASDGATVLNGEGIIANNEPQEIIDDIKIGMKKTDGAYVEICDRKEAIRYAIVNGQPGDVIVLAGKGHEDYQEIKGVKYAMDERDLIADILAEEREREQ